MSTSDEPKNAGMTDLDHLDPPMPILRTGDGRVKCTCGMVYSREIVVIACTARGHRKLPDQPVGVD